MLNIVLGIVITIIIVSNIAENILFNIEYTVYYFGKEDREIFHKEIMQTFWRVLDSVRQLVPYVIAFFVTYIIRYFTIERDENQTEE